MSRGRQYVTHTVVRTLSAEGLELLQLADNLGLELLNKADCLPTASRGTERTQLGFRPAELATRTIPRDQQLLTELQAARESLRKAIRVSKNEAFDRFILWNIMYDGVLAVELPEGASIVGFADDLAILAAGTTPEYAAAIAEEAVAAHCGTSCTTAC